MLGVALSLSVLQATVPIPVERPAKPWVDCGEPLTELALQAGSGRLFVLAKSGRLLAYQLADARELWRVEDSSVCAIDCTEKALIGTGPFPTARRFDPATGVMETNNGFPHGRAAEIVADPGGRWVWIGTDLGVVRLVPGEVETYSKRSLEGGVTRLALDRKGELLAIGGRDGKVRFTNAESANVDEKRVLAGPASPITALALGPKVLLVTHEDRSLRLWNLATNKQKLEFTPAASVVHELVVDDKAAWFASGDADGNVHVRSLGKDVVLARATSGKGAVEAMALEPKEGTLFVASGTQVFTLDLEGLK